MNALIAQTHSAKDEYFTQVNEIISWRMDSFFSEVPVHEFLSDLMATGIHGVSALNQMTPWDAFKYYLAELKLPFEIMPIGLEVMEDREPVFTFKISHNLSGHLKGHSYTAIAIVSEAFATYVSVGLNGNIEDWISENDWSNLAISLEHKHTLLKLAEA